MVAVSHVGVEVDTLRRCMKSEEAASVSYQLRSKYTNRVSGTKPRLTYGFLLRGQAQLA